MKIEYSFDDGGKNDMRIASLLEKYHLHGTFYIVVDYIGQEGYLNWNQVKELDRRGHTIGSHTLSHPMDLKKLHESELIVEIFNSKQLIENVLGHKITTFCYPRGRMDNRVRDEVIRAGYLTARGTGKPGITKVKDKFYLPGTIHIYQRKEYGKKSVLEFAKEVIDRVRQKDGYCNIWGHSREIDKFSLWDTLEEVIKYAC